MKEALILAGGEGRRLASVTRGGQKVVVNVGECSFLETIIDRLYRNGFSLLHLAVGYRAQEVAEVVSQLRLEGLDFNLIYEAVPLGTGGAVKNALPNIESECFLVLNGDSYNDVDYSEILNTHRASSADASILTKRVPNVARYGTISVNDSGRITSFNEKTGVQAEGVINAGVYVFRSGVFSNYSPVSFSLEDFLSKQVNTLNVQALESPGDFIDIGIPEDFQQFKERLKSKNVHK